MKLAVSASFVPSNASAAILANVTLTLVASSAYDIDFEVEDDSGIVAFTAIFDTPRHDFGAAMGHVYDICTLAFLETDSPLEWVSFWGLHIPEFDLAEAVA